MIEVGIHEAKTHLSRLVQRAATGEEVVISRAGKPVARLVAIEPARRRRALGEDKGAGSVADDFDAPLPDDILASFEGGGADGGEASR